MQYIVCSVRDRATDGFGTPMFFASVGVAIRSFTDEVNRSESVIYKHPDDYDLYQLAIFDDATGGFEVSAPTQIAVGKNVFTG